MSFENNLDCAGSPTGNSSNALLEEYLTSSLGDAIKNNSIKSGITNNASAGSIDCRAASPDNSPMARHFSPSIQILSRTDTNNPSTSAERRVLQSALPSNPVPPAMDIHNRVPHRIDINNHATTPVDVRNRIPRDTNGNYSPSPAAIHNSLESLSNPSTPRDKISPKQVADSPIDPTYGDVEKKTIPAEVVVEGHKQLRAGLEKGHWPEKDEGKLMLGLSLLSYCENDGKEFLDKFARDSNDALQMSDLKDKVKISTSASTADQRGALAELAKKHGAELSHSGILEMRDQSGKVTDRRMIAVFTGSAGKPQVAIIKI